MCRWVHQRVDQTYESIEHECSWVVEKGVKANGHGGPRSLPELQECRTPLKLEECRWGGAAGATSPLRYLPATGDGPSHCTL